jgi:hypothetical protein
MSSLNKPSLIALQLILMLTIPTLVLAESDKSEKKESPKGTPILWRRPTDIASRDLRLGPGGAALKTDLRRVTFLKDETGKGYSTKYRVRDAAGQEWVAKIGKEAQAETAAVRLLWALGYMTEINYLEPTVEILGKGTFHNVRFEARPKSIKRLDEWKWRKNPFLGTREFQGLKVLMALINNWDIKDANNKILYVRSAGGDELRYIISDLGATFGQSGSIPVAWRFSRSRNEPAKFADAEFVDVVVDNNVFFHYGSRSGSLFGDITVQDAMWTGSLLSQLSTRQLQDAFRAANYTPSEVSLLTGEIRERTNELLRLQDGRLGRRR